MFHNPAFIKTGELLKKLGKIIAENQFILAGGTALALQINHRLSIDLDFFGGQEFSMDRVLNNISRMGLKYSVQQEEKGTLTLIVNGIKVSFFHYPYPFVQKTVLKNGIPLANILDIASMKVIAICQRGTKRDFVDLYFVLQDIPFRKIAENMVKRFGKDRINPVNIGKSLVYFKDAESDPPVRYCGKIRPDWALIKSFFIRSVRPIVYDLEALWR